MFEHIKIFILNKITYHIVKLLNLRNIPFQLPKYTFRDVVVLNEKKNLNFKEKMLELLSFFFTYLSIEYNKWFLNQKR